MSTFLPRFSTAILVLTLAIVAGSIVYTRYIRHHRKFEDPMRRKAARARDLYFLEQMKTGSAVIAMQLFAVPMIVILLTMKTNFLWVGLAIQMLAVPGTVYWLHRNQKRFQESIRGDEFRICPNCFYSLRGSLDAGRCPECGYGYTIETLREEWCHTLNVKPEKLT